MTTPPDDREETKEEVRLTWRRVGNSRDRREYGRINDGAAGGGLLILIPWRNEYGDMSRRQ